MSMRINKFLAQATGLSRRAADRAITEGRVTINGEPAQLGVNLQNGDEIKVSDKTFTFPLSTSHFSLILLHKPAGYVCSRNGQGSRTIYDLLPADLHHLKPVGRLDKDSSGLLLLTDDGNLAYHYTHPKFEKEKVYEVELDNPLTPQDQDHIEKGVKLEDGLSAFQLSPNDKRKMKYEKRSWIISMSEGRNRQIRRTFAALGYKVIRLHRTSFGPHQLGDLTSGKHKKIVI